MSEGKVAADIWPADCKRGREEAAALIAKVRATHNPLLLRTKLASLGDFNLDGVANGFATLIGEKLIGGR